MEAYHVLPQRVQNGLSRSKSRDSQFREQVTTRLEVGPRLLRQVHHQGPCQLWFPITLIVGEVPNRRRARAWNILAEVPAHRIGPVLVQPLVETGELIELSQNVIMPYYRDKAALAAALLQKELAGVPHRIHAPEGAIFLWLWLPGLPVTSAELYRRLKRAGVFVLSGHYFFPGLNETWRHRDECLRISFAQDEAIVREGIGIIGREVRNAFGA